MGLLPLGCISWFCDPLCCVFDIRKPCSCPHGKCYTIMMVASGVGAMYSAIFGLRSCFFFQVQMVDPKTGYPVEDSMLGYGYFSREAEMAEPVDYDSCVNYSAEEYDVTFNDWWFSYGKMFFIMAVALGGLGAVIISTTCCFAYHTHMFEKLLLWIYLFAAIFQGLAFLGFGTHHCATYICKVGPGTQFAISSFFMWLTVANFVKSAPEALPPEHFGKDLEDDEHDDDDDYDSDDTDDDNMYYYSSGDDDDDDDGDEFDVRDEKGVDGLFESSSEEEDDDDDDSDEYEDDSDELSEESSEEEGSSEEEDDDDDDDNDDDDDDYTDNFEDEDLDASDEDEERPKKPKAQKKGATLV